LTRFIVDNPTGSAKRNNIQSQGNATKARKSPAFVDSGAGPAQDHKVAAVRTPRNFHPKFTSPRA
jgi:hypothetical protein